MTELRWELRFLQRNWSRSEKTNESIRTLSRILSVNQWTYPSNWIKSYSNTKFIYFNIFHHNRQIIHNTRLLYKWQSYNDTRYKICTTGHFPPSTRSFTKLQSPGQSGKLWTMRQENSESVYMVEKKYKEGFKNGRRRVHCRESVVIDLRTESWS